MKILWHSTNPNGVTGYCNQTRIWTKALSKNYDLDISAYRYEGAPKDTEGGRMYMSPGSDMGSTFARMHYKYLRSDLLISLTDPHGLNTSHFEDLNYAAWVPVDSLPPKVENILALKNADYLIAMSLFGASSLKAVLPDKPVFYVPHGIETNKYIQSDKGASRKKIIADWQVENQVNEDTFLISSTMANVGRPGRKNFPALFKAVDAFTRDVYENTVLYLHTDYKGFYNGEDLMQMRQMYPNLKLIMPPFYKYFVGWYDHEYLSNVYSASDVYIQTSRGEGFGIPIIEAQSSGCPVIVTNYTAMPELAQSGWTVNGLEWHYHPGSYQMLVDHNMLLEKIQLAFDNRNDISFRNNARKFAEQYDYNLVLEKHFLPTLEKIKGLLP